MSEHPEHEKEPNDPTRSGASVPVGKGASLSQNEVEQLCLKAARGAGMDWGLAEEAGFAAAWLALRGLDGPGTLLAQLQGAGGRAWSEICPSVEPGRFAAKTGGCLCPVALGAALCDHAGLPETATGDAPLQVGPVDHPLLLLPFLADLARARGGALALRWPGGTVIVSAAGEVSGDMAALSATTRTSADLVASSASPAVPEIPRDRLFVAEDTLGRLNDLALRTTVPASEASRAGAGAALSDND